MKFRIISFLLILKVFVVFNIQGQHRFIINLNDIEDDLFKVTVIPDELTPENDLYQFAAIAPGTYQVMDVGRFVRSFVAYDMAGNQLEVEQVSTNQWKLADPTNTAKIQYTIAETWDTPVDEHLIYNMAGTSLEEDHAFINHHCVLGYFHGMQSEEIWVDYEYNSSWEIGTPMKQNDQGYYVASTYDFVVDSPTLLGRLSKASMDVEGTQVDVFTYSKTDMIQSEDILKDIEDILFAASKFTGGLPVDRYVFLYHFEDTDYGAWEHSYSSIYALREAPFDQNRKQGFRSIAAHEFYHVVTPLNIHSEVVEQFNYETPELSRHLWLYEGVTEWAAWTMQVRAGIITPEEYLAQLQQKLTTNDGFNQDLSLTDLGLNATELSDQYVNIYHKGAMTAGMLDLLLLKKSKGRMGLREVVNDLSKAYGPSRPFDEIGFFDELIAKTYPEVSEFVNRFIQGTDPLPLDQYFGFVGVEYQENAGYDSSKVSLGLGLSVVGQDIVIASSNSNIPEIQKGDIIKSMDGIGITLANAQQQFAVLHQKRPGDIVHFTFLRGEEEVKVDLKLPAHEIRHQLRMKEKPRKKQLKLREKWLSNS